MREKNSEAKKNWKFKMIFSPGRGLLVLLLILLFSSFLHGHSETVRSLKEILARADEVAVAEIIRIEKEARQCSTKTRIFVKPLRFIKGSCDEKRLTFTYTVYQWRPARFFWQKDCPSVHYRIPPRLSNPKEGQETVVTIEYFKDQKEHFVTSMSRIDKLHFIKKIILQQAEERKNRPI